METRCRRELYDRLGADAPRELLDAIVDSLGYANTIQFLANRHTLHLLYGAYAGCHEQGTNCILEPRFELENHDKSKELEAKSLLPYRLFDLLVARG